MDPWKTLATPDHPPPFRKRVAFETRNRHVMSQWRAMFSFPNKPRGGKQHRTSCCNFFACDATSVVLNSKHEEIIDPGFIHMPRTSLILENESDSRSSGYWHLRGARESAGYAQGAERLQHFSFLLPDVTGSGNSASTHTGFALGSSAGVTGWQKTHRNCSDGFSASS